MKNFCSIIFNYSKYNAYYTNISNDFNILQQNVLLLLNGLFCQVIQTNKKFYVQLTTCFSVTECSKTDNVSMMWKIDYACIYIGIIMSIVSLSLLKLHKPSNIMEYTGNRISFPTQLTKSFQGPLCIKIRTNTVISIICISETYISEFSRCFNFF